MNMIVHDFSLIKNKATFFLCVAKPACCHYHFVSIIVVTCVTLRKKLGPFFSLKFQTMLFLSPDQTSLFQTVLIKRRVNPKYSRLSIVLKSIDCRTFAQ